MHGSRPRFSPRRRLLLATVALALAAMAVLRLLGIAGFNGTAPQEMDWNDDGVATRAEIARGFTLIAVEESRDGPRSCRRYVHLRDRGSPIRVECRVEFEDAR